VVVRLLEKRNLSLEQTKEFLSWDLKALPDLTAMMDMEKGSQRIIQAIENGEKIGIYGDYDVDGTTSCALFYHFFKMLDIEVDLIQPSRFVEGYGIHPSNIESACEKGIQLLITVDCGISNVEAAEYALEKGVDLIITDHHKDACEKMPPAYAIINPNRRDEPEDSPLRPLAGVGVAFAVCVKVKTLLERAGRKMPTLYPLLEFVAIGTICDLAKLTPTNLKMVRHGLKHMKDTPYPGVRVFFTREELSRSIIPSEKLSFNIGPMINSKGRLDHPEIALKLLICDNETEAREYYAHLEISNNERKYIQGQVYSEAKEQVLKFMEGEDHLISVVYSPEWHEGVIGIVASKLVENFKVPAIVFSDGGDEGVIKASARSAGELNIFELLNNNRDLFIKFGGHKAAAGLSMPKENLKQLVINLNSELSTVPEITRTKQQSYDLDISFDEITPKLLFDLEMLEPFGMGNEKPTFRINDFQIESYDILKDVHVRWNLTSKNGQPKRLKGISFNFIGKWNQKLPEELYEAQKKGEELSAYFTPSFNYFNGNQYLQLMIDRVEY
jgi:single-stranded-DNA-specific exonuclease